jgi:hypothetical protein
MELSLFHCCTQIRSHFQDTLLYNAKSGRLTELPISGYMYQSSPTSSGAVSNHASHFPTSLIACIHKCFHESVLRCWSQTMSCITSLLYYEANILHPITITLMSNSRNMSGRCVQRLPLVMFSTSLQSVELHESAESLVESLPYLFLVWNLGHYLATLCKHPQI